MMKVMVVDDYPDHVDTLVSAFSEAGCEVVGASRGSEALEVCKDFSPDLIICDGLLPDMKAWQFGYNVLQESPPVRPYMVALTGSQSNLQRRLCEECGFDEYVTKPIDHSTLLDWVFKARKPVDGTRNNA